MLLIEFGVFGSLLTRKIRFINENKKKRKEVGKGKINYESSNYEFLLVLLTPHMWIDILLMFSIQFVSVGMRRKDEMSDAEPCLANIRPIVEESPQPIFYGRGLGTESGETPKNEAPNVPY